MSHDLSILISTKKVHKQGKWLVFPMPRSQQMRKSPVHPDKIAMKCVTSTLGNNVPLLIQKNGTEWLPTKGVEVLAIFLAQLPSSTVSLFHCIIAWPQGVQSAFFLFAFLNNDMLCSLDPCVCLQRYIWTETLKDPVAHLLYHTTIQNQGEKSVTLMLYSTSSNRNCFSKIQQSERITYISYSCE